MIEYLISMIPGLSEVLTPGILIWLVIIGGVTSIVFYHITIQKLLDQCSEENRQMKSSLVWLNWIPIFNLGWQFYVYIKVRDSLKLEFESRGLSSEDKEFGYNIGLTYGFLYIVQFGIPSFVPAFTFIAWIAYWIQLYKYYKILNKS